MDYTLCWRKKKDQSVIFLTIFSRCFAQIFSRSAELCKKASSRFGGKKLLVVLLRAKREGASLIEVFDHAQDFFTAEGVNQHLRLLYILYSLG
jgi:hypothetical protein